MESAFKTIAESEQKLAIAQDDMKTLREQFEAAFKRDEDNSEAVQEVHDMPLKEAAVFDSVEDQDSPGAEERSQHASSSMD